MQKSSSRVPFYSIPLYHVLSQNGYRKTIHKASLEINLLKGTVTTNSTHLDNANLLEVVGYWFNSYIFTKSLNKNGVVVRIILLATCKVRKQPCYFPPIERLLTSLKEPNAVYQQIRSITGFSAKWWHTPLTACFKQSTPSSNYPHSPIDQKASLQT